MKLSDYIFRFLADAGVMHVFMLPGGGAMHLNDSLGRCKNIEYVCNLHEQACAIAAEAYSKVTSHMGVALVTSGPGATNAITGVAAAWQDSTPVFFLSGQVKRDDLVGNSGVRQMGTQEIDIVSLVKPITKYAVTVMDPASIRVHLEKAFSLAKSNRPGPVWIDVPLDVQAAEIDPESLAAFIPQEVAPQTDPSVLRGQVAKAIALLNDSARPILLAGNGIRIAGGVEEFRRLVDRLGIPVLTTWAAIDLIPDSHGLLMGRPGSIAPRGANFALQNSDYLLSIGTRLDAATTGYSHDRFARAARKVIVDIDATEIGKLKMPIDVPVCADAKDFLAEIWERSDSVERRDRSDWLNRCRLWKKRYPVVLPEHRERKEFVSSLVFSETLSGELCEDDIIVPTSAGASIELFFLAFRVKDGQRMFHNRGTGAMGLALPASIGACLAGRKRRTICIDGDGGIQFNIQELETVARLRLPVKIFVLNNQGYASIRASQKRHFGQLVGADATSGLTLPDIVKVAEAYGIRTERISNHDELGSKVRKVLDSPGPILCDVLIASDEVRAPCIASRQRPDGSMISSPLEDLWPFLDRKEFLSNMIIPPLEESR